MQSSGAVRVVGGVRAAVLRHRGGMKIGGELHARSVKASGTLSVGGKTTVQQLDVAGRFNSGLVRATHSVALAPYALCVVDGIDCEGAVSVRRTERFPDRVRQWLVRLGVPGASTVDVPRLQVDVVRGDSVDVADVEATTVAGRVVRLRSPCVVDTVMYVDSCDDSSLGPNDRVAHKVRVDKLPPLTEPAAA